jgi:hypothetical protein
MQISAMTAAFPRVSASVDGMQMAAVHLLRIFWNFF